MSFLSMVSWTYDLDPQTHLSKGPNMSREFGSGKETERKGRVFM